MKGFTLVLYASGNNRLTTDLSLPKSLLPVENRPRFRYNIHARK